MWIPIGLAVLLLAGGAALLSGRGAWMIAGYNTLSPEEKGRYHKKALCRAVGAYMLLLSAMVFLLCWINTTWMAWTFAAALLLLTAALALWLNKDPRFRK